MHQWDETVICTDRKFCHSKFLTMELQPPSFQFFCLSYLCQFLLSDTGAGSGFPPWGVFAVGAAGIALGVAVHCEHPSWPRNRLLRQHITRFWVWRVGRWAGLNTGCSTLLWSWQHWSGIWSMWNGEIQCSGFLFFFLKLHRFQFFKFGRVHMIWKKRQTDFFWSLSRKRTFVQLFAQSQIEKQTTTHKKATARHIKSRWLIQTPIKSYTT